MAKPRLLWILSRLPYPPVGGDRKKSLNQLRILAKYMSIHLVVVTDERSTKRSLGILGKYVDSIDVYRKRKFQCVAKAFWWFVRGWPLQVGYYYFGDVARRIDELIGEADVALATLVRCSPYVRGRQIPVVLDLVDQLSSSYGRSQGTAASARWRMLYRIEGARLARSERAAIERSTAAFLVNWEEAAELSAQVGDRLWWVPLAVDDELFDYTIRDAESSPVVAFFGKMDYQPNIDAVLWFTSRVLKRLDGDLRLTVVGARPTHAVRSLQGPRVTVTGFVSNPYRILADALAVVAPMRTGGGMQTKIVEAMAMGKVCILSSLAARAIKGAHNGIHLIVADTAAAYKEAIQRLTRFPQEAANIGQAARILVQQQYCLASFEDRLVQLFSTVTPLPENIGDSARRPVWTKRGERDSSSQRPGALDRP